MKTPYEIQYQAFAAAGGLYDERHAKLYAEFADDLIADGSFSIVYEGAAHACYTPIKIDAAPHLKCYVLGPFSCVARIPRQRLRDSIDGRSREATRR